MNRRRASSIDLIADNFVPDELDLRHETSPEGAVTILFTDIQGSTALNEQLGDERWMAVLRGHNRLIRAEIAAHGGREVKAQGDGFMVSFASATGALRFAIGVQRRISDYGTHPLRLRIGLHSGFVIEEAADYFGRHVVIAARIAGLAEGGEILVSGALKRYTEADPDFSFGRRREVELRGLAGSYVVHEVRWRAERPSRRG